MNRFPDKLLLVLAIGTILCCSISATGLLRHNAVNKRQKAPVALPGINQLHSGDIIFRDGKSFISQALKQFNRIDSRFSHAGIIHLENGKAYVIHSIGGEESIGNAIKKESLESFCAPSVTASFSVFHPDLDGETLEKIDSAALRCYSLGAGFDSQFDLATDNKLYCTEMIYKIFSRILGEKNFVTLTSFGGVSYVACDDIFAHSQMREYFTCNKPLIK